MLPARSAYLPAYAKGVRAGLEEIGPKLIGLDPTDLGVLNRAMDAVLRGHHYVKAPVDVACCFGAGEGAVGALRVHHAGARRPAVRQDHLGAIAEHGGGFGHVFEPKPIFTGDSVELL